MSGSNVKQVIVVRRDLSMKRGKLSTQIAHAAMKFLIDNNEAERGDEMRVKLSQDEALWLSGSMDPYIATVDSEAALQNLIFKAQLHDIEVYPVVDTSDGSSILTCAAFGPCDESDIDKIASKLSPM